MKQQLRHTDAYLLLLAPVFIMMFVLSMAIPVHSAEQTISHVSTSDELIAAIESSEVTSIVFDNNIIFDQYCSINSEGAGKTINGNGYTFGSSDLQMTFNCPVTLNNFIVNDSSSISITANNGLMIDHFDASGLDLFVEGTVSIEDSTLGRIEIFLAENSIISRCYLRSICINQSGGVTIDACEINPSDSEEGISVFEVYDTDISITDTSITGGETGCSISQGSVTAYLNNVSIFDVSSYGLRIDSGDGSCVKTNGLTINNSRKSAIYCAGGENLASLFILEGAEVFLECNTIGIVLHKGQLYVGEGAQINTSDGHYALCVDRNSMLYDSADAFVLSLEKGNKFYNTISNADFQPELITAEVSNEEEFRQALLNENVSVVNLVNDITIEKNELISISGFFKSIDGHGKNIDFQVDYGTISASEYLTISNVNLFSDSTNLGMYLENGADIDNVNAKDLQLYVSGPVKIIDTNLLEVSLSGGDSSLLQDIIIQNGGISIYGSKNVVVKECEIYPDSYREGINLSGNSVVTIEDTRVTGGWFGIYLYLNGCSASLHNVTITGCSEYGIYDCVSVNSSNVFLDNVSISDTGGYSIYCEGQDSFPYMEVIENSTLEIGEKPIMLDFGTFSCNGNILTTNNYCIYADSRSDVFWNDSQVISLTDPKTGYSLYRFTDDENTLVLPLNLRSVESAAFENDDSIEAVIIPENVIDIGERAFADCNQLSSVTIVNTATTIEDSAFDGCEDVYFLCPLESQAYYYAVNHGIPYKEYEE